MKRLTGQWAGKAESDFQVAKKLARGSEPHHNEAAFHAQQSAEKYLKAILQELGISVPRTHILEDLILLLVPHHASLNSMRVGGRMLTRFAVATRYPGKNATKREAVVALKWADRFRSVARKALKIRPKRKKGRP